MSGDEKRLQAAFLQKERNQNFLSNLTRLKSEGSVTQEQYEAMKSSYQQSMTAAVSEISNIKNQLKLRLQATQQHISTLQKQMEDLNIKHKVGEIPFEKYQNSQKKLTRIISQNETAIGDIQKLMTAKSSTQVGIVTPKFETPVSFEKIGMPDFTSEGILSPLSITALIIAGVMLITVLFLPAITIDYLSGQENVTFMKADTFMGGICLLAALAFAGVVFIKEQIIKGRAHVCIAIVSLIPLGILSYKIWSIAQGSDSLISQLVGYGVWLYAIAAIAGIMIGIKEMRD